MAELSLLTELMKKQSPQQGQQGLRGSPRPTAMRGFTRGSLGSMGSTTMKDRNPQAGYQKEMDKIKSPIFQAFMRQLHPATPVSDYLRGAGS